MRGPELADSDLDSCSGGIPKKKEVAKKQMTASSALASKKPKPKKKKAPAARRRTGTKASADAGVDVCLPPVAEDMFGTVPSEGQHAREPTMPSSEGAESSAKVDQKLKLGNMLGTTWLHICAFVSTHPRD